MNKTNSTKRILINAVNLTGAGARSIGLSLIPNLVRLHPQWHFCILVPDEEEFRSLPLFDNAEILFEKRRRVVNNDILRLWEIFWQIPRLAEKKKAKVCLTLGDINPAGLPCPGVVFVQQALLAYEQKEHPGVQTWPWGKRLCMQKLFSYTVRSSEAVIVQSAVMAQRLHQKYKIPLRKIQIIRQPVPQALREAALAAAPNQVMAGHKNNIKLLFLAKAYPHKNHAILAAVAQELRRRDLAGQVRIYTTIEGEAEARLAKEVLQNHGDVITNLGALKATEVAGAFKAASALFLPTLIESYGLIYLEAMTFGLPILTSDRDFAREMCRDQAIYFDPHDPLSIVDAIQNLPAFRKGHQVKNNATAGAGRFPSDWKQVARGFMNVVQQALAEKERGLTP
ncbi:glycosyltransferase [candidate division TA06 bacterium]|uniref:Glycosyltransferase n=1 Tax=candidate division TA06 bacterium TaxID=2250710 RepID=A0A933IA12_UNCT6|nr:glycosyltransferase [candidate division TA06 bacterium]